MDMVELLLYSLSVGSAAFISGAVLGVGFYLYNRVTKGRQKDKP